MAMNRLRIGFSDFWNGFDPKDNFIRDALEQLIPTEVVKRSPDLLIYSVFGSANHRFVGPKLLVNGEPFSDGHGNPDFSIGFHESTDPSRLRLPVWAWKPSSDLRIPSSLRHPDEGHKFCAFIYSNPGCGTRNSFYSAVNRRKPVDSLGSVFGSPTVQSSLSARFAGTWQSSKIEVLTDYRFTIAFENVQKPGYSTEKIADAFLSGSIPIYWGDPFVEEDFNGKAFVNSSSFRRFEDLIDYVLWLESNPAQRLEIRQQIPMNEEQYNRYFDTSLVDFLRLCIEKDRRSKMFYLVRAGKYLPASSLLRWPLSPVLRRFPSWR
jgi:hypothetical protein